MKKYFLHRESSGLKLSYEKGLNKEQYVVVMHREGPMLVLAGAGTGKTRTVTYRVARLMETGIRPENILLLTFTNKAAKEMRGRIENLLNVSAHTLWIGTFHGIAHRLLRRHAKEAKLPETFQVMDSGDQLRVIKRLINALNLDDSKWPPREVQWYINAKKDEGINSGVVGLEVQTPTSTALRQTCWRPTTLSLLAGA